MTSPQTSARRRFNRSIALAVTVPTTLALVLLAVYEWLPAGILSIQQLYIGLFAVAALGWFAYLAVQEIRTRLRIEAAFRLLRKEGLEAWKDTFNRLHDEGLLLLTNSERQQLGVKLYKHFVLQSIVNLDLGEGDFQNFGEIRWFFHLRADRIRDIHEAYSHKALVRLSLLKRGQAPLTRKDKDRILAFARLFHFDGSQMQSLIGEA